MKTDQAAHFIAWHMWNHQTVGSLLYMTWNEFVMKLVMEFCPKNKLLTLQMNLEMLKYFQGSCNIDEYVDKFCKLIDWAQYFEGAHIVMKFRQGLNPRIQDYVTCVTSGQPSDEDPKSWYAAAILCDKNHIANKVFKASSHLAPCIETTPSNRGLLRRPPMWQMNPPPITSQTATASSCFVPPNA